jgi:hypothetical protein
LEPEAFFVDVKQFPKKIDENPEFIFTNLPLLPNACL